MVISYVEAAACGGSVLAFLRYLDGPLKSVAETAFIVADMDRLSNPGRTKSLYTLKNVGYSWKQVRKQVLIWLGSSFDPNRLNLSPMTEAGKVDQFLVYSFRQSLSAKLAASYVAGLTYGAPRFKELPLTDDSDDFQCRLRLDDPAPFPYQPWRVTSWSAGPCPVIQSVSMEPEKFNQGQRKIAESDGDVQEAKKTPRKQAEHLNKCQRVTVPATKEILDGKDPFYVEEIPEKKAKSSKKPPLGGTKTTTKTSRKRKQQAVKTPSDKTAPGNAW